MLFSEIHRFVDAINHHNSQNLHTIQFFLNTPASSGEKIQQK
jgi:hypothetical protein